MPVEEQAIVAKAVDLDALLGALEDPDAKKKQAEVVDDGGFKTREQRQAILDQQKNAKEELDKNLDLYKTNQPS